MCTDEVDQGKKRAESSPVVHAIAILVFILHVNPGGNSARAQSPGCETDILQADDKHEYDRFGWSTSVAGDWAFFGAYVADFGPDNDPVDTGSVYVFKRDGFQWTQRVELNASDGESLENFGYSVSASGDLLLVGSRKGDKGAMEKAGAAYIYRREGETWIEEYKVFAGDAAFDDRFGHSVSLRGDWAVVGAPGNDDNANKTGSIYFYRREWDEENTTWTWVQRAKKLASDRAEDDQFGISVATTGDWAIAGAPNNDDACQWNQPTCKSGSAYIFQRTPESTTWTEVVKLVADDTGELDKFGNSVAIDGDVAIVGAKDHPGTGTKTGAVYVFRYNGSDWVQETKLLASDGAPGDRFGHSVSLSRDHLIVGAYSADSLAEDAGAAYWFRYDGAEWKEWVKFTASDGSERDWFGYSVATDGSNAAIGAYKNSSSTGAGYTFTIKRAEDCNGNGFPDYCDIADGISADTNGDNVPDECECFHNSDCDDGLACTLDACRLSTARCDHVVEEGFCVALTPAGVDWCWPHGTPNPGMDCTECNALVNQKGWSPMADGTPCTDDGLFCTGAEVCISGTCQSPDDPCAPEGLMCDDSVDGCVECLEDADCDDDRVCTDDSCNTENVCEHHNVPAGTPCGDQYETDCNYANICDGLGSCDPNLAPHGTPCTDDGLVCTLDWCDASININQCVHTVVEGFCLISGVCHEDGAARPYGECHECNSTLNQSGWSPSPGGSPCEDDGLYCTLDQCDTSTNRCVHTTEPDSCLIGETCYADGDEDPANPCRECNPAIDQFTWSPKRHDTKPAILHVDPNAANPGCGSNWRTAFRNLHGALELAIAGDTILVADGTYTPDPTGLEDPREATFKLVSGVEIYGGYAGFGARRPDERNVELYQSILSGDLNGDDGPDFANNGENSYHVVTGSHTVETAGLDGLTITGGNASGHVGGGMLNSVRSLTVNRCKFMRNRAAGLLGSTVQRGEASSLCRGGGGAMYNADGDCTVTNTIFQGNESGEWGGAVHNNSRGKVTLTDCTFINNRAQLDGGGLVNYHQSSMALNNCAFINNDAGTGGGLASHSIQTLTLANCLFKGNTAEHSGGAIYVSRGGETRIVNSRFVSNSAEQGGAIAPGDGPMTVTRCQFESNGAEKGGAIYVWPYTRDVLLFQDCEFVGNHAQTGGGLHGKGRVVGCLFANNSADQGGVMALLGTTGLTQCTLAHNVTNDGSALAVLGIPNSSDLGDIRVTNSVLWNNGREVWIEDPASATVTIDHSDVYGGWTGPGINNIDAEPLFVDPLGPDGVAGTVDDDLRLASGSPCIDAGDNDAVPPDTLDLDGDGDTDEPLPFDLDGNLRFVDDPETSDCPQTGADCGTPPIVDMGAYEYQPPLVIARLDIRPEMCPNHISRSGKGLIRIAIVGTESFDVADVDIDSLVLTRADGEGGEVYPITQPHGLGPNMRDVTAPFEGELCDCHALGHDGMDDLVLRFNRGEMANALRFKRVPAGAQLKLKLAGSMVDGTPFAAWDCVALIGNRSQKNDEGRQPR